MYCNFKSNPFKKVQQILVLLFTNTIFSVPSGHSHVNQHPIWVDVPQNTKQTQQPLKKTRALKSEVCLYQAAGKSVCAGSRLNGPLISCISSTESSVELMTLRLGQSLWLRLQFLQDILSVCLSDAEVSGRRREWGRDRKHLWKLVEGESIMGVIVLRKLFWTCSFPSYNQRRQRILKLFRESISFKIHKKYIISCIFIIRAVVYFILHKNKNKNSHPIKTIKYSNLLVKNHNQ